MGSVIGQALSVFRDPGELLYPIGGWILWPVLVIEIVALFFAAYEFGRFTIEMLTRDRKRSIETIERAAQGARIDIAAGHNALAVGKLSRINENWLTKEFAEMLGDGSNMSRPRLIKIPSETELIASKRLGTTRVWIHLAPIIGLMTTLIPLSPALVALAKGDVQTLSGQLVLAFSTTVVGLLISGITYFISTVREWAYLRDIGDIEYALELLEV
jgi:biopolymer transport protein ExbB/TolQ